MLQAYALRRALGAYGCDVRFLRKFEVVPYVLSHPYMLSQRVQHKLGKRMRRKFFVPTDYQPSTRKLSRLAGFRAAETPEVQITKTSQWNAVIKDRTTFVAGSDITWNPHNEVPGKYFLDMAVEAGLPCFSYAASIGSSELPVRYARRYKRYLSAYQAVSVREAASIELLRPYYAGPIAHVVDPTLLLTRGQWDEVTAKAELSVSVGDDGYLLCYFVMEDSRYWQYVREAEEAFGLSVVVLPMHEHDGVGQGYLRVSDATPYEFVWLIKHASFVITDSFHACTFCLTYEKEFYLLRRTRKAEDDKYDDFLGRYALQSRSVPNGSAFLRSTCSYSSDTTSRLVHDRHKSIAFIEDVCTCIMADSV